MNCSTKNRPASILDLNNYFKIKDLLGGLTTSQQAVIRRNIGIRKWETSEGDTFNVEVFYEGENPPEDTDLIWIKDSYAEYDPNSEVIQTLYLYLEELNNKYKSLLDIITYGVKAGNSSVGARTIMMKSAVPTNPLSDEEDFEAIEPLGDSLTYTVPNLSIKVDTASNFIKNLQNLIDGELCWVADQKKLFIYYQGQFIYIGESSISKGVTIDEIMVFFFDYLGFKNPKGDTYRVSVDNNGVFGSFYYEKRDPSTVSSVNTEMTNAGVYIAPRLNINSIYCGGDGTEYSYQPCSHNFIELANAGPKDVNLDSLYLLYTPNKESKFKAIPLKGKIKSGSTYLVRGAQCAVKTNTTIINVNSYDLEWYDGEELIKFEQDSPTFYLAYGEDGKFFNEKGELVTLDELNPVVYIKDNIIKGYIDSVGINTGSAAEGSSPVVISGEFKNCLFIRQFMLDPAQQAVKAYTGRKSNSLWTYIDLTKTSDESLINPLYYYSKDSKITFTPKSSKENKNIFTTRTTFDENTPNMVNITFGIQATDNGTGATRCFNWVSVGYYDEYIEYGITKDNLSLKEESIKEDRIYSEDGSDIRDSYKDLYKRIRWITTNKTAVTTHKVIIRNLTEGTYYYRVRRYGNDEYKSPIMSFKVDGNISNFSFIQVSDQQGFNWPEYQVWKKSSYFIAQNHADVNFTINTGDITQNGNRESEWLDYYEGRQFLRDKEEMFTIGNNDLCGVVEHELGDGTAGTYKINHRNILLYYTFEVDPANSIKFVADGTEFYMPSLYSFNYGEWHFISLNSEFTSTTYKVYKEKESITGQFKKDVYRKMSDWFKADVSKYNSSKCIVYCHEMPFTVITNDTINKEEPRKGSKLNDAFGEENTAYYWSRLFKHYGIRLVMGGHKHTYSISKPVYDAPMNYLQGGDLFDEVSKEASMKPIVQVTELPETESIYARYELVDKITAPIYVMTQATGYKLVSNKDIPTDYSVEWLDSYFPGGTSANPKQYFPMYVYYEVSPSDIKVYPYQITEIYSEPENKAGSFNINNQSLHKMEKRKPIEEKPEFITITL